MDAQHRERVATQALWSILFCGRALTAEALQGNDASSANLWKEVERLADRGELEIDRFGRRIYGVLGITLVPTTHEIEFGKHRVYARSPHLALELLRKLNESATLRTPCPSCARRLSIVVCNGTVIRVRPRRHRSHCFLSSSLIPPGGEEAVSIITIAERLRYYDSLDSDISPHPNLVR